MTKEEIIDELELYTVGRLKKERVYITVEELQKYIDEIKVLEQEPCDDAISRQATLDEAFEVDTKEYGRIDVVGVDVIVALPPVTPKPKTGHWIMSNDDLYRPICNNCGAHPWKGYIPTVEEAKEVFKYCPNCGAKMLEPQERSNKE